jgi:hypothetical protein
MTLETTLDHHAPLSSTNVSATYDTTNVSATYDTNVVSNVTNVELLSSENSVDTNLNNILTSGTVNNDIYESILFILQGILVTIFTEPNFQTIVSTIDELSNTNTNVMESAIWRYVILQNGVVANEPY